MKILKRVLFGILGALIIIIATASAVRTTGRLLNSRTPKGGINESLYVDINGTKQWISIYGKDKNNPVLLYLHGGPGYSTSMMDYAFTRKWADVYTVVTWDQRACGKSWLKNTKDTTPITLDATTTMMEDGVEMTEFLRSHLGKDKISIIGHSWGSIYGAMLVQDHPEYYDCFIGTGMVVDLTKNEERYWEAAREWAKGNEEDEQLIEKCASGEIPKLSREYYHARQGMMEKYGYNISAEKSDYSIPATCFFNPYYSLWDWYRFKTGTNGSNSYLDWDASEEFNSLSILDRTEYKVPYYNINGDMDYQANSGLAQDYFDSVKAPRKKMYYMKNMAHGLLEVRSGEFSDIVHEIAAMERAE